MDVIEVMLGITLTITFSCLLFAFHITPEEVKLGHIIVVILLLIGSICLIYDGIKRNSRKY